jgi:hypothetical protein
MTIRIYRSTDAGAPVLNSDPGSLISVLDGCLVTGYGAKPSLGWTKVHGTATTAGYRRPSSFAIPTVFQVNDGYTSATMPSASYAAARVKMIENSDAFDQGFNVVPPKLVNTTTENNNQGQMWSKATNWTEVSAAWTLIGDEKGFYYIPQQIYGGDPDSAFHFDMFYFGKFTPFNATDIYTDILTGNSVNARSYTEGGPLFLSHNPGKTPDNYLWILRDLDGVVLGSPTAAYSSSNIITFQTDTVTVPNQITGKIHLIKVKINDPYYPPNTGHVRGYFRNFRMLGGFHTKLLNYFTHNKVVTLNGREFLVVNSYNNTYGILPIDGEYDE